MESKNKKIDSASKLMHKRYIKGDKKRLENIEQEGKRLEVAQQIFELRSKAGLTQKEFAERVGMKQSVISRLESTDYRGYKVETLERIAKAMNQQLHFHFEPDNISCAYP